MNDKPNAMLEFEGDPGVFLRAVTVGTFVVGCLVVLAILVF